MIGSLMAWNCRGAGSHLSHIHLLEMLRNHKPDVLALLETRVSSHSAKRIVDNSHFTDVLAVEARGFADRIWLLWDRTSVTIEEISMHDQILNVLVTDTVRGRWVLSLIYASPHPMCREELWLYIKQMGEFITIPWLLIGDFNQPLTTQDKYGGRAVNWRQAAQLQHLVDACQLLDLGFQGPKFTWFNCRTGRAAIRERIDIAWCNLLWHHRFPEALVYHLPRTHSDHHPLLLNHLRATSPQRFRGFYFLEAWLQHGDFRRAVETHWDPGGLTLQTIMENFKQGIMRWNQQHF